MPKDNVSKHIMNRIKQVLKKRLRRMYSLYTCIRKDYYRRHPRKFAGYIFYKTFSRHIDWDNPNNLNEKINWLKFHEHPKTWATLADKYAVRKYVEDKGLSNILIPLYGKWDKVDDIINDLESLPNEFVLKCNNGCGLIHIVNEDKGGKNALDVNQLKLELQEWLDIKGVGLDTAEPHYSLINNCIIAEKLLTDNSVKEYSRSLVDYKIWCFDGRPFGCLVVFDRDDAHGYKLDFYDLDWNQKTEYMSDSSPRHRLPRPQNYDFMLEAATKLSEGHPQVRVDFYCINGQVFFGEMTFTSLGGYMTYFTEEALVEMGRLVTIDLGAPRNDFWR